MTTTTTLDDYGEQPPPSTGTTTTTIVHANSTPPLAHTGSNLDYVIALAIALVILGGLLLALLRRPRAQR